MLVPGTNCWRIARADRAAFLIDGEAYFAAFRAAVERARERIILVGWDIDSRVQLGRAPDGSPITLMAFLNDSLTRRPELQVFALAWDFSVIFTLEREPLPSYRFAWNAHPRLAFRLDDEHPLGASHHQKIVAIDGTLAFAGGVDLTIRRWDTPAHSAEEADRVDPAGKPYPPLHDVQMMVDGEAAAALDALARARWQAATGQAIPPQPSTGPAPWPEGVTADVEGAPIGVARTMPPFDGVPPVLEVLQLTLDAIGAARRWIYIENQYLTSAAAGGALARRLAEPDGPEIVIVLPREEHGWLEQSSMGVLRARLLRRLLESDRHGRLRLYYPTVPDLDGACVNVHAKVMVIDDRVARVGSANLSNRSMGLDSECDLVLDAELDARLHAPIARLRDRLLGEHLGVGAEAVAEVVRARGSLIAAVEALREGRGADSGARTLVPLPHPPAAGAGDADLRALDPALDLTFLDGLVCDPERPAPDLLLDAAVPASLRHPVRRSLAGWGLGLLVLLALAALWRLTPLRSLLDLERVTALGASWRGHRAAPAVVLTAYVVGGLVLFPITLLTGATVLVFPPASAIVLGVTGTLSSAMTTYWIGRLVGRYRRPWTRRPRLRKLQRQLRNRGTLAIVTARLLPVGNFSLINMTAGAIGIRFRDYMLGNVIGVVPGILLLTVFADRLGTTIRRPRPANLVVLVGVTLLFFATLAWLRKKLRARK